MTEIIFDMVCHVSKYNINIKDSYKVTNKKDMTAILYVIQHRHPECEVFQVRKWNNLLCEWQTHNRLFKLGISKSQTKDVDLDTNEPWWRRILYSILGI